MRIFKFKVEYYDKEKSKVSFFRGLIAGENLGSTVTHIENSFFDDTTIPYSVKVDFIEDMDEGVIPYDEIPNFEDEED